MNMHKNALMLADTRPALVGHILLQIQKTNRSLFDEALIFYSEISTTDMQIMNSIMPCRFIKYNPPLPEELFTLPRFQRFSPIMFARYEIFKYLNEFESILWLDTDIYIRGDLSELIELGKKTGFAMLCEDPENNSAGCVDFMRTNFFEDIPEYDMQKYLYCTGTLVVNQTLPLKSDYTEWCYKKTIELAQKLNLPDQGIFNALFQEFNLDVVPLGQGGRYGCFPSYRRDCSNAHTIHAWGSNKFWNDWYLYKSFPEWGQMYQKWLSLGGSQLTITLQPKVSVVIPTYKPDLGYFKQCLDSLVAQKRNDYEIYSDFEIIIVAEPFNQKEIQQFIDSYHDPRINLIFNEQKLGIAGSLNKGLRYAQGQYIARIDDDDIAAPERLYKQVIYLDENPSIHLCTTDYNYFGDMNEGRRAFSGELSKAWSIFTCPFDHPTTMFRKSFFINNSLFYDETRSHVEDWELWLRAFEKGMVVGAINEVLFYHRWHNGSAGQTSKTSEMMCELVKLNFAHLNVNIQDDDLKYIAPWSGSVSADVYEKISRYFDNALKNNLKLKHYDQLSLQKVFSIRLHEAQTGLLPEVNIYYSTKASLADVEQHSRRTFNSLLKKILAPFYRPIKNRYENRIINTERLVWNITCDLNIIKSMIRESSMYISRETHYLKEVIQYMIENNEFETTKQKEVFELLCNQNENFKKDITSLLEGQEVLQKEVCFLKEKENLLGSILTNTDEIVKFISHLEGNNANLLSEKQKYYDLLIDKMYERHENTMKVLGGRIQQAEKYIDRSLEDTSDKIHTHIDFTYRDIMVVLNAADHFIKKKNVQLITNHPIAQNSNDYLFPRGTMRDNTRYPRFIKKCEDLLNTNSQLSFLDLGCSGGGMVLEAALKGHFSMGLEGSDYSLKQQRAEWRLLGDNLCTCDITKPFQIMDLNSKQNYLFDIITAWEVLEHIQENDLPQLFSNIRLHLHQGGYFIASVANWDDIDPNTGINWHICLHDKTWWEQKAVENGFAVCNDLIDFSDLARGGYNPPLCYENIYPEIDVDKDFYLCLTINN